MEIDLKEQIKELSKKYKEIKPDEMIDYLNHILEDRYDRKCYNLRLYNNLDKTKKIYLDFILKQGLNNLLENVVFINENPKYKESGIYDKRVIVILKNNTKDLFDLVRYTILLEQLEKGNDEIVSYIKAMLIEKKLLDYLVSINYSQVECEKIKKCNLMEILYISNLINCGLEEVKIYNQVIDINYNLIDETEQKIKKHIDNNELFKYNLMNSKKYIYGIIYSSYLHQKLSDEDVNILLNTNLKFNEFKELYIKEDKEKILNYYNIEYRS